MSAPLPPFAALRAALDRGSLSAVELVERCLERIAAREPDVRAWAVVDADGARAQAAAADDVPPRSPLHGVPVGIKDIIDTRDLPTERGTPIHRGRRPAADAACVARLRAAGAIVLGKTVTTEFATWTPADTRNPLDLDRTPGGSSSGSAAAVADGMVALALGTQTVGSTIRPAAFCGMCALKPTHGAASLDGVLLHSDRLDTLGAMAADPAGVAALWRVLADAPTPSPDAARRPPRIAVARTPWWDRADPGSRAAVERVASRLAERGATVRARELPAGFDDLPAAHMCVTQHDVARSLALHADDPRLSPGLRALVERGLAVDAAARRAAIARGDAALRALDALWAEHDALLVPAVTGEAPLAETGTGDALFCQPWSLLGTPAATVPGGTGSAGLPIGVQLVAPHGHDLPLLDIAALAAP